MFPYDRWQPRVDELSVRFRSASPFPHLVLSEFLDLDHARALEREFPAPDREHWIQYKHFNENKLGQNKRSAFPELIGKTIDELNSPRFAALLSKLTGIEGLMADAMLEGGGMHQTEAGGFLNMHADFSNHHYRKNWRRRVNLIVYLNEGWDDAWGGALELWNAAMEKCEARISPALGNAVIFATEKTSFHGYPDPIRCPAGRTRKSLALYYYTEDEAHLHARSTDYRARPGERWKAPLIWLDKKVLHVYSLLKTWFGLSDDFASRVLGRLFGKRR